MRLLLHSPRLSCLPTTPYDPQSLTLSPTRVFAGHVETGQKNLYGKEQFASTVPLRFSKSARVVQCGELLRCEELWSPMPPELQTLFKGDCDCGRLVCDSGVVVDVGGMCCFKRSVRHKRKSATRAVAESKCRSKFRASGGLQLLRLRHFPKLYTMSGLPRQGEGCARSKAGHLCVECVHVGTQTGTLTDLTATSATDLDDETRCVRRWNRQHTREARAVGLFLMTMVMQLSCSLSGRTAVCVGNLAHEGQSRRKSSRE